MKPALSPFELIKKGAAGIINKGKEFASDLYNGEGTFKPDSVPGIVRNTVVGLPTAGVGGAYNAYKPIITKEIPDITKGMAQGTARGLGNLGAGVQSIIASGVTGFKQQISSEVKPKSSMEGALYGTDQPFTFTSEGKPFANFFGADPGSKTEKIFSPIIGLTFPLLDAIPGGKASKTALKRFSEEAVENFAKSTDPKQIGEALFNAGVDKKIVKMAAEDLAKTNDPKQVKNILNSIQVNEATPNVSRSEATKELGLGETSSPLKQATPSQVDVELPRETSIKRSELDSSYDDIVQRPIKDASEAKRYFNESEQILREMTDLDSFPVQRNEIKSFAKEIDLPKKSIAYKDIGNISKGFKDVYRNFETVFKKEAPVLKTQILDKLDDSKGEFINMQKSYLKSLDDNIVKDLKIKRGSKESEWLMKYGEQRASYDEVLKVLGKEKADNIVKADKWFRETYNDLIDQVNATRKEIYPNSPERLIPKRENYYRHFTEMTDDLSGLKNIFETSAGIDPKLAGLSPFTKPKSKWLSFAQKRTGTKTTDDAVGGFLDYLPSASYAIHLDPNIGRFRALAESLADSTQKTGNLNNFIDYLNKFANDLSGKTNDIDRIVSDFIPGGRKTLRALDWVNRRVKANTILGSASASLAQIFNVPQGIASAKKYSVKGFSDTMADIFRPNTAAAKSTFLNERNFRGFDKFDTGFLDNAKNFAGWMTSALDKVGTRFIWNSHYEKALAENIPNPIRYADDVTKKLVGGRGVGEVPLIQKSKIFQLVAPFQLEVANLWHVMGDFVKKKDFGALAILFVANHIMNKGAEAVRGSGVVFDPIQAATDAYQEVATSQDKSDGTIRAAGRIAGEALSNLPLGQTVASAYPEYGFDAFGKEFPTRKKLFGDEDPTRFGSGILASKAVTDPLYNLVPPFGGNQLKKTIEGAQSLNEGGVFTSEGNLQFKSPEDTQGAIQTLLFGKYSNKNAREYFDKDISNEQKMNKIAPVYEEVQRLKSEGKGADAINLYKGLGEEERKAYDSLKEKRSREATTQGKKDITPVYREVQKLKAAGKTQEALDMYKALSEKEQHYYQLMKKQFESK